jgi:hypothetical protein
VIVGPVLHGVDVHLVRAVFTVLVGALVARFGAVTLLSTVVGIYYVTSRTPYPSVILTLATIVAGIAYDLYLHGLGHSRAALNAKLVPPGILMSGLGQSVVTLGILSMMGFFPPRAMATVWSLGLARNAVGSFVGGVVGVLVSKKAVDLYGRPNQEI